jgi:hypothetical protein
MVVGRCAQPDGVTVRGVAANVEAVRHMSSDKGTYDNVAGVIYESDGDEDGADNILMVPTAASRRDIDMRAPVRGKFGDPVKA